MWGGNSTTCPAWNFRYIWGHWIFNLFIFNTPRQKCKKRFFFAKCRIFFQISFSCQITSYFYVMLAVKLSNHNSFMAELISLSKYVQNEMIVSKKNCFLRVNKSFMQIMRLEIKCKTIQRARGVRRRECLLVCSGTALPDFQHTWKSWDVNRDFICLIIGDSSLCW